MMFEWYRPADSCNLHCELVHYGACRTEDCHGGGASGRNRSVEAEKILIPIANPDTIEDLINLSLVIRDPKQRDNLLALNVINDDSSSESAELRGKRYLERLP